MREVHVSHMIPSFWYRRTQSYSIQVSRTRKIWNQNAWHTIQVSGTSSWVVCHVPYAHGTRPKFSAQEPETLPMCHAFWYQKLGSNGILESHDSHAPLASVGEFCLHYYQFHTLIYLYRISSATFCDIHCVIDMSCCWINPLVEKLKWLEEKLVSLWSEMCYTEHCVIQNFLCYTEHCKLIVWWEI